MSKSLTAVMYPLVGAVAGADQIIGAGRVWHQSSPTEEKQAAFLQIFAELRHEASTIPEMVTKASLNIEELNALLRSRGFSIQLQPPTDPRGFGVVSILDLLLEWLEVGTNVEITAENGQKYAGVRLSGSGVKFGSIHNFPSPVVQLATKTDDLVYLTLDPFIGMTYGDGHDDFLLYITSDLMTMGRFTEGRCLDQNFGGVRFPKVLIDQQPDISWLVGLQTTGQDGHPYEIDQAIQQTKIGLNEKGAKAKSAAAIVVECSMMVQPSSPDYVIDRPFVLMFKRPGLASTLAVAHVGYDDWRDPGDLAAL